MQTHLESAAAHLSASPYFDQLAGSEIEMLAQRCIRHSFDAGEIIFLEGDPSAGLWLIAQGSVKVFKVNPDGEEHILHLLGAGKTFNDIAALDGGPNPANAAALNAVVVWLLPVAIMHDLLANNNQLAVKVIGLLTARVRNLVNQVEDLALYTVQIRLARFLLKQAEDPSLSGPGITRAAIAAHLATTPESVSRILRSLEEAGAIQFNRHEIIIVSEKLLRAIAAL